MVTNDTKGLLTTRQSFANEYLVLWQWQQCCSSVRSLSGATLLTDVGLNPGAAV